MRFVCNLPRIMRLFDFGRNYAKNYASIICQGLTTTTEVTTTVNIRKRGRPRKLTSISDTGQVGVRTSIEIRNGGDVTERTPGIAHLTFVLKYYPPPTSFKKKNNNNNNKISFRAWHGK